MSVDFRTVEGKHGRMERSLVSGLKVGGVFQAEESQTLRQLRKNRSTACLETSNYFRIILSSTFFALHSISTVAFSTLPRLELILCITVSFLNGDLLASKNIFLYSVLCMISSTIFCKLAAQ